SLAEIDAGKPQGVELRLKPFAERASLDAPARAAACGIIGDALDAMGEFERAFESYSRKGEILRAAYAPGANIESQLLRVQRLKRYFTRADKAQWTSAPVPAPGAIKTHVFVLGFARSGTTLLENVLATHPALEVMAEHDGLKDCYPVTDSDAALDAFAALDAEGLQRYRDLYWQEARSAGMPLERTVFVDKLPLNSVVLCLIAKLFPRAKIVFALRDPRDVVFSSFRRRFGMTPQMYELTTLEGAARYYDAVMALVQVYRRVLTLDLHEVRLENLVTDFKGEMDRLCGFLGVAGTEAMQRFEPARTGRDVTTPSAAQLAKGLNAGGLGPWRNYAGPMAEVTPLLQPWVAAYGYGDAP
ncbi:MAG: sulfotransferase, partial [Alphaproteobacteria bacterium]|nr:sulfotransferase [Alphaproteobacteria bacterium]